jgi:hypothetical protein
MRIDGFLTAEYPYRTVRITSHCMMWARDDCSLPQTHHH